MAAQLNALTLAQDLIRCPSVTPVDGGALDHLQSVLEGLGFTCHRLTFSDQNTPDVDNLYARIGSTGRHFCFAGHSDVVPVGDTDGWRTEPFAGIISEGRLYGRGAVDMKSAIAAFTAAAGHYLATQDTPLNGSISLLITGDEEGPAINGTVKVLDWLAQRGEVIDACIVGEPTNPSELGDMIKIGRRGSLTGRLTVNGTQGHSAYPHLADNPLSRMLQMLAPLATETLDTGSAHFPATTVAVTSIDTGNEATNVIPAKAHAVFNIRFNDLHSAASLEADLRRGFDAVGGDYDLQVSCSGESFLTEPGSLSQLVSEAVSKVTGKQPELSTTGGTSDARFIQKYCQVVEFGLVGQTMHKVNEHVAVADITALTEIYQTILEHYFESA
jgi:succinyl-diaminopimelate desuccinylase